MKTFDQWMQELLKDAFLQAAEDDGKVPLKTTDEAFGEDDFEEE